MTIIDKYYGMLDALVREEYDFSEGGETMSDSEYGELLKQLRKSAGLTQKELGMACGYDEASADANVRLWETGKTLPTLRRIRSLANALNVNLDKLIP